MCVYRASCLCLLFCVGGRFRVACAVAVELGVRVCPSCVQRPFHPWSVWDSVRSLLSVASVSSHLQPHQTAEIKLLPALNANFNKSHFCVCFFPLTQTSSCMPSNYHLPSHFLPFSPAFPSLFIHLPIYSSLLCCPSWPLITPPIGCDSLALR